MSGRAFQVAGLALAGLGVAVAAGSAAGAGSLGRTALAAGVAALVALAMGLTWALALVPWRVPGRRVLLVLGLLPLVSPPYLAAVAWVDLLGPAGALTRLFGGVSSAPAQVAASWVFSPPSVGLVLGGCLFPLVALAAAGTLRRLDPAALDAVQLVRGRGGVLGLLLAAARGPALAAGLLVFALAALEFAVPQLLRVKVQSEEIYLHASEHRPGQALLAAAPLLLLAWGCCLLALPRLLARGPQSGSGGAPRPLGRAGQALAVGLCLVALLPGALFPALALTLRLIQAGGQVGVGVGGALNLAWQVGAPDAWRSAEVGLTAAVLGLALVVPPAWALRRGPDWARGGAVLLALALAACPAHLVGSALLELGNRPALLPLLDSLLVVALACLVRFLPLAGLVAGAALARVPAGEEEAARLAGVSSGRRLLWLGLPHAGPALVACWGLLYALSVTEYGASVLVAPPGASVLAVFVVNEAHYGQGDVLAGLLLLLLGVLLAPLPLLLWVGRRARGRLTRGTT